MARQSVVYDERRLRQSVVYDAFIIHREWKKPNARHRNHGIHGIHGIHGRKCPLCPTFYDHGILKAKGEFPSPRPVGTFESRQAF
jgi:hypothetical protein